MASSLRIALILLCTIVSSGLAYSQDRFALVIGNNAYSHASALKTPVRASATIAAALKETGFSVTHLTDINQAQMKSAMRDFSRSLRETGAIGFFYYSGYALQTDGENYLLPINADVRSASELDLEAVPLNAFLKTLNRQASNIAIAVVDAHLGHAAQSQAKSENAKLAAVDAPAGIYVSLAYSRDDRPIESGSYGWALANAMFTPGASLERVFRAARASHFEAWPDAPSSFEASSVVSDFSFVKSGESADREIALGLIASIPSPKEQAPRAPWSHFLNRSFVLRYLDDTKKPQRFMVYISEAGGVYFFDKSDCKIGLTGTVSFINRGEQETSLLCDSIFLSTRQLAEVSGNTFKLRATGGLLTRELSFSYDGTRCSALKHWFKIIDPVVVKAMRGKPHEHQYKPVSCETSIGLAQQ